MALDRWGWGMQGFFLLWGLLGIVALTVPVALVLGLLAVFVLRGEPDDGARGITLYLSLATFVGFLTLLLATTALSVAVTDLVSGDKGPSYASMGASSSFSTSVTAIAGSSGSGTRYQAPYPQVAQPSPFGQLVDSGRSAGDRSWTALIQAAIAMLAAGAVLWFHWPRLEAVGSRATAESAAARMRQSYCYVACLAGVLTLLVTATIGLFNIVQAIAPGTTGAANRGDPIESFVPLAVLGLGAAALFRIHWSRVEMPAFLRPIPPSAEGTAPA
ncbi:MAG: hypothetical protein QOI47_256 [Actinomycetota bacterium]|nr:hypothetical protein [Actinomycetota bacterium]